MPQPVRITRSLGVVPSVFRGFDVSGFHRTEAEYDDRIPDGTVLVAAEPLPDDLPAPKPLRPPLREIILSKGYPKSLECINRERKIRSARLPELAMLSGDSSGPIPLCGEDPPVDDLIFPDHEDAASRIIDRVSEAQ